MELKVKTNKWINENVLKGFEVTRASNKYNRLNSQINNDLTIVVIRVAHSNLKYSFNYDAYYAAYEDDRQLDVFGQKWFKTFNVLESWWENDYYYVVFNKSYFKGDWDELLKCAMEQDSKRIEILNDEMIKNKFKFEIEQIILGKKTNSKIMDLAKPYILYKEKLVKFTTKEVMNVRATPSLKSKVIKTLPKGFKFSSIGFRDVDNIRWALVVWNNKDITWIATYYLADLNNKRYIKYWLNW